VGLKNAKNALAAGAESPGLRWIAHDAPPDPLVSWGPNHHPLGASILAPSALRFCGPSM